MKRRILSIILVLSMLSAAICVRAEERTVLYSGVCGDNLTWEIDDGGTLTISGSGELYDYALTEDVPWNGYCYEVFSVKLDIETSSICTSEGNCAFGMLDYVKEITIPEGVKEIPESQYFFPYSLKKLILPCTYTGELSNNKLIRDLSHAAIEVAEDNPVYSSIDGTLCNKDKTKLIQYTLSAENPDYVIPDTIVDIDNAFIDIRYLESLTISKNVEIIDMDIYNGDFSKDGIGLEFMYSPIEAVYVDEENPYFCSVDGVLYNKDMTVLIWCPRLKTGDVFSVPETVKVIAAGAFANSKYQNIQIPEGVEILGGYAFYKAKLESVTIPSSMKKIYLACFIMSNLSKVHIESCDAEFSPRVFEGDSNLKTAGPADSGCDIEYAWTDCIPSNVFSGCNSLTAVTIPATVKSIEAAAFDCQNLKNVYYNGTRDQWRQVAVRENNEGLLTADIHCTDDKPRDEYPYIIGDISIQTISGQTSQTIPNGSPFVITISLTKLQERNEEDCVFIAMYSADRTLIGVRYVQDDFKENDTAWLSIYPQKKPIARIKAFVWDSFTNMTPLAESKIF